MGARKHIDEDLLRDLVEARGWPTAMLSEKFGVSDATISKRVKDYGIARGTRNYAHVIMKSAGFSNDMPESFYSRERVFAKRMFAKAPDIRYWAIFNFKRFKFNSLVYFCGAILSEINRDYFQFEVFFKNGGFPEVSSVIKCLDSSYDIIDINYTKHLGDLKILYRLAPDKSFWINTNISGHFNFKTLTDLDLIMSESGKKVIEECYASYNYNMLKQKTIF